MSKDKNPYLALRIQVESGGCHGFQYVMSLTTIPPTLSSSPPAPTLAREEVAEDVIPSTTTSSTPSPPALSEDDTILTFTPEEEGGEALLTSPKVVLDLPSLELLKGSKVDYTMELIGSQFKIVDNPLATSSCGCGTSFDIKI
jgi:Fe-S cluster assembly iron-binding protein IscA